MKRGVAARTICIPPAHCVLKSGIDIFACWIRYLYGTIQACETSPRGEPLKHRRIPDTRHAGFERVANEYGSAMLRLAAAQLGGRQLAEDAVQEALIKLYVHVEKFIGTDYELKYVMRTVLNACRDIQRSAWHKKVTISQERAAMRQPQAEAERGRMDRGAALQPYAVLRRRTRPRRADRARRVARCADRLRDRILRRRRNHNGQLGCGIRERGGVSCEDVCGKELLRRRPCDQPAGFGELK